MYIFYIFFNSLMNEEYIKIIKSIIKDFLIPQVLMHFYPNWNKKRINIYKHLHIQQARKTVFFIIFLQELIKLRVKF